MLKDFLKQASSLRKRFPGVESTGVSIGGPLDARSGVIYSPPNLPGWNHIPLRDLLVKALGLPVRVEHDAIACLAAEWLWGAARGSTHAVYFTAGTGFGAGIMINGRMIRGPSGQTCEIGHVRLADYGPRTYGKEGCVESFCSGTGIALLAGEMFPREFRQTDTRTLCRRSNEGDANAKVVLGISAMWTGRVCAMLADLFGPEVIILGSMARYLPNWWITKVRRELRREALPRNCSHTLVVAPGLGDSIQDLSSISPCLFPYDDHLPPHTVCKPSRKHNFLLFSASTSVS